MLEGGKIRGLEVDEAARRACVALGVVQRGDGVRCSGPEPVAVVLLCREGGGLGGGVKWG